MTSLIVRVPEGKSPKLAQEQLPLPRPGAGQVLVKVSHVAQNPTDGMLYITYSSALPGEAVIDVLCIPVQCFDINAFGDGAVLGCDFVGEVTELGSGVTRLAKGDVIAGLIWGGQ